MPKLSLMEAVYQLLKANSVRWNRKVLRMEDCVVLRVALDFTVK